MSELDTIIESIQQIIKLDKTKKQMIEEIISSQCIHLEYYDKKYDDHNQTISDSFEPKNIDYYCVVCHKRLINLTSIKSIHEIEKLTNQNIWVLLKKWRNESDELDYIIKNNEKIIKNIYVLKTQYDNNICVPSISFGIEPIPLPIKSQWERKVYDTMEKDINSLTCEMYYKCKNCECIGFINS